MLAQSVTIFDVDMPEMKMEPSLQIQQNMLAKSWIPMKKMFGERPKKTRTPLVAGDLPEKDLCDFCNQDQIKEYQTVVGQ